MNGAQWLVRTLRDKGVKQVFVLCGNGLNPFLDACLDYKVKIIDVRNEQAAAYMADTYGRLTGTLGVVAVSAGPGHTNALTGVTNSWWDGGPMLLISGCSPNQTKGLDHFQELDQVCMAAPVTKYARHVHSAATLPIDVQNALTLATTSRPGPVHLTIPSDVFNAQISAPSRDRHPAAVMPVGAGDGSLVRDAVKMLHAARRPLLIVGSGAFYANAWAQVRRFLDMTNIPAFTLLWDRGCIEKAIPQYVGVVTVECNPAAELIPKADVIMTIGGRVDFRLSYGRPPMVSRTARFIRVDADPSEVNRVMNPEIGIVGSPRSVLQQMIEFGHGKKWQHQNWLLRVQKHRQSRLAAWDGQGETDAAPVSALKICRTVRKFLKGDVTFLLDGGNIGRWTYLTIFDRHPSYWHTCGISGVVGWGIPGAIAAKLARPDKPVLLLSGDGAAGFTLGDIQTAVRFNTPFTAVVADDEAWGIVVDGQKRPAGSRLGGLRFDRVAEAMGARGVYIDHPDKLGPAIRQGLNSETVTFIHVPTILAGIRTWQKQHRMKLSSGVGF